MNPSDYILITPEHLAFIQMLGRTILVDRQPSETEGLFLDSGHYKLITANGEAFAEGPVWILWDADGYPFSISPEEFEKFYKRKEV